MQATLVVRDRARRRLRVQNDVGFPVNKEGLNRPGFAGGREVSRKIRKLNISATPPYGTHGLPDRSKRRENGSIPGWPRWSPRGSADSQRTLGTGLTSQPCSRTADWLDELLEEVSHVHVFISAFRV
jgi:hypothetical protein